MLRRLPLSPKQAGKEYYKGNGVGSMGTITKHGKFKPDYTKIRTYVFPARGTENSEVRLDETITLHWLAESADVETWMWRD